MLASLRATRRRQLVAVLVIAVLTIYAVPLAHAAPAATLEIDHFDTTQGPLTAFLGTPASGFVNGADIIGGQRDVQVTVLSGTPNGASMEATASEFHHSQDTGITAQTLVQWDGADGGSVTLAPNGLGGVDLTQAGGLNAIAITVDFNDLPTDLIFTVYSGVNSSRATLSLPGGLTSGPPIVYYIPYGGFTTLAGTGANFASVGAIEMLVDGKTAGADLTIHEVHAVATDWGDLPDAYVTRYAASGASGPSHEIGTLFLGSLIDATETDGLPSVNADGDDLLPLPPGPDDEDGVKPTPGVNWQRTINGGSVDVTVTGGAGCLSGWIDWNGDGDFADPGENMLSNVPVNAGTSTHTFAVPVEPGSGAFYARFRLYAQDAVGVCTSTRTSTGAASNGEVEDYHWSFGPNAVSVSNFGGAAMPVTLPVVGTIVTSTVVLLAGLWKVLRG